MSSRQLVLVSLCCGAHGACNRYSVIGSNDKLTLKLFGCIVYVYSQLLYTYYFLSNVSINIIYFELFIYPSTMDAKAAFSPSDLMAGAKKLKESEV